MRIWATVASLCLGLPLACSKSEPQPRDTPSAVAVAATGQQADGAGADPCAPRAFDSLLRKYVVAGRVDYAKLKADKTDLQAFDSYLGRLGECDASKLEGLTHYAFWVNAYNAFNIKGVLDAWPVENIKSVPGFLDKKPWRVAHLDLTLNDMEYKQLIPPHKDARAHFAVVCADLGSVAIADRAYTAENLESTLEQKSRAFASDPHNLKVDMAGKRVSVSMLFSPEWYEKDFLSDPRFKGKKAVEYLVPYVDSATAQFLSKGDYRVDYIDWDWSLNAAR